jgi:stage 0 sporulation protein B (sporulation initiation phosphotransferase)
MERSKGSQIYVLILVFIGLIGIVIEDAWIIRILFAILTAIFGYTYIRLQVSILKEQTERKLAIQRQEAHKEMLGTINHIRHDWMNDIQVLFGYIQLKKFDNLTPYMEKIKAKMQQESLLSKLGVPSLVAYLLSFRVHNRSMQLEVELEQEIDLRQLPIRSRMVAELIEDTVELFKRHADSSGQEAGVLSLEFDLGEDYLLLDFVYQGCYHRAGLEQGFHEKLLRDSGDYQIEETEFQDEEAAIALRVPYRT